MCRIVAIVFVACLTGASCASGPRPYRHTGGTLRLMFDRDVVEILMAHCEAGVTLTDTVQLLDVPETLKARARQMGEDEKNDLQALTAWVQRQPSQPSQAGKIPAGEVRTEHLAAANELKAAVPANHPIQATRVLDQHLREQKLFLEQTPVKDRELQVLIDAIWQRLSDAIKTTSRAAPGAV